MDNLFFFFFFFIELEDVVHGHRAVMKVKHSCVPLYIGYLKLRH